MKFSNQQEPRRQRIGVVAATAAGLASAVILLPLQAAVSPAVAACPINVPACGPGDPPSPGPTSSPPAYPVARFRWSLPSDAFLSDTPNASRAGSIVLDACSSTGGAWSARSIAALP